MQTYYRWRSKYAGLMPSELKRLRQLEEENGKLKKTFDGSKPRVLTIVDAATRVSPAIDDGKSAADMLGSLGKGQTLLADAAYDTDQLREDLAKRGAKGEIKPMPGRLIALKFNKRLYKKRNAVERFFNKMKHFRAIATRYEKHAENFLALVKLAAALIWMRSAYESVT